MDPKLIVTGESSLSSSSEMTMTAMDAAAASPSLDSLEQFSMGGGGGGGSVGAENNSSAAATPLSTVFDECQDGSAMNEQASSAASLLLQQQQHQQRHSASPSPLPFDAAGTSTRFRRHSSQSTSLTNIPLNLSLSSSYGGMSCGPPSNGAGLMSPLTVTSTAANGNTDRICSVIFAIFKYILFFCSMFECLQFL